MTSTLIKQPTVAVIIPYYQREPGILTGTLESVFAQTGDFELCVVVTDDDSPIPAEDEISKLRHPHDNVKVVKQRNAGPGAARNACLDNLPPETKYVALLDSDDQWEPGFLDIAVSTLERGYDLFFANSSRYAHDATRFTWESDPALNLDGAAHTPIDEMNQLYEYRGDFFDFIVKRSNILGTSTMVYRLDIAPTLRFDTSLYNGQDRLFKLHLGQRVKRAAFTPRIFALEGEGINIFDSAVWGSKKVLVLLSSYISLCKKILADIPLTDSQNDYVRKHLAKNRHDFCANLLHIIKSRETLPRDLVLQTFRADPATAALMLPNMLRAMWRKLAKQSNDNDSSPKR